MGKESDNKNVADFKYKSRKYEVDLLLDSMWNGFASYDVFDVTNKKEICVGSFIVEQSEEDDYMLSEIKDMTIREIENGKEKTNL